MKVLYNTQTQEVSLYPRNDDEPVIGLSPEYLVLEKVESDPPSPTAISSWEVNLEVLEYRQVWTEPEPPPPTPDWLSFNLAMMSSSFTDWLSTFQEAYRVAAIQAAANRNLEQFQQFYDLLVQTKKPLSSETAEWQSIADEHNVQMRF